VTRKREMPCLVSDRVKDNDSLVLLGNRTAIVLSCSRFAGCEGNVLIIKHIIDIFTVLETLAT